ncbi:asparagine synthase (glutamine-hydrolyzing) [Pedobacter gandavensis]|uniref:asparagine synthase (glutamine-hydrolyzing) n=1 Tax=Pedobacter gandavensis TaxID=2679963 RepID=UPI0029304BA2|nr:asparagine synthase (glutamine-hydrolyzing) [Pedobacter gandavensis]
MCGIFGTLNYPFPINEQLIFDGLAHRGPDEQGSQSVDQLVLYHTRLAIQDLSLTGRQPMEYNGLLLIFNGEIYNHLELREKHGLEASSTSDTRTILMMFEKMGMKMLEEFDGMFAFALYDLKNRKLYLARDRAGKKPLYIYRKDNHYVFSSELSILARITKPEIDQQALADYLYLGYHYRASTPYLNISELENGHYLEIDTQQQSQQEVVWFKMEAGYQKISKLNQQETLLQLEDLLTTAVSRRLHSSDLPVGSFLSGGIDSGLVTAIAAKQVGQLHTFTVRVPGSYDESALAAQVAQKYDTNHTVVDLDFSNLKNDIEHIISAHGEPNCDNSAIPGYYVAKAAKAQLSVVLNGDGADELFGGYRRYVPFRHIDFFKPNNITSISAKILSGILPIANEKQSYYTYIYRLLKFASYTDVLKIYCSASSDLFVGFEDMFIRQPLMKAITTDLQTINKLHITPLNKLLLMDFQSLLFSRLLPKMDIATMAHSLEGRSPFLSKELLEFAPGLPDQFKINQVTTKYILRELARKYLPDQLLHQPKRGFEIPLRKWVDEELNPIIRDYLMAKSTLYAKIIKRSFVEALLARKINVSDERRAKMLFCIFGMEVWYSKIMTSAP